MNCYPRYGVLRNDGFVGVSGEDVIAIKKRVLAGEEWIWPCRDASKTLGKRHIDRKVGRSGETQVNVLLMVVPHCPKESPFLNWIWMVKMIRDEVVEDVGVRSSTAVIDGIIKTKKVGRRRIQIMRWVGAL